MSNPARPETQAVDATTEVNYEKRFKDTQGAFTKSQQELKAAQAKIAALSKLTVPIVLDEATRDDLESLKYSDPDAWRNKINTLEAESRNEQDRVLNEAASVAYKQSELESRAAILADFQVRNPTVVITDDVIKYDVPPRITSKLESGKINFEEYLTQVHSYLAKGKKVGDGNTTLGQPNLGGLGGDSTPTPGAVSVDIVKDYNKLIF